MKRHVAPAPDFMQLALADALAEGVETGRTASELFRDEHIATLCQRVIELSGLPYASRPQVRFAQRQAWFVLGCYAVDNKLN